MPLTQIKIIRGLISLSCGQSSPHFSKMPKPKFSTSTSDFFNSSLTSSRPLGVCMLTVNDFLPRCSFMKSGFLFHSLGSSPRWPSPRRRVSQRMTSAPNSQSTRATVGPAAPVVNSTTRMPSRGNWLIKCLPTLYIDLGRWSIGVMECWDAREFQHSNIPVFHHSILSSDHPFGSKRDEIVVVLADHRMFHIDEEFPRLGLLHLDEFAGGIDRRDGNAALLPVFVKLFFRILRAEFHDSPHHDVRMLPPI